jgi:hypothetical protein
MQQLLQIVSSIATWHSFLLLLQLILLVIFVDMKLGPFDHTVPLFPPSVISSNKEEQQKSIFTRCDKRGYRLRDNVLFHLYISTSPCGDARIFSPHEAGMEGMRHPTPYHMTVRDVTKPLADPSVPPCTTVA